MGMSLKLTGCPVMGFMTAGFLIFQLRAFSGAAMRMAACTLSRGVSDTLNALPAHTQSRVGASHVQHRCSHVLRPLARQRRKKISAVHTNISHISQLSAKKAARNALLS